jgi:choline dehydrogenase-like flavoprotein
MSLLDSASIPDGDVVDTGVCIVGGGPAGIAIATELERAGVDAVLLESGGARAEPEVDALAEFDVSGEPLRFAGPVRRRLLGGTTASWHGRLGPLDPIDFERRDWVSLSGWPIPAAAVDELAPRAAAFLGLERPEAFQPGFWASDRTFEALGGGALRARVHLWPRRLSTARLHMPALRRSARVRVVPRAHVTRFLARDVGDGVGSVEARGQAGNEFSVRARAYVLACGGLENPRLLLLSRDRDGRALGDQHDAVGRYYMNHPRGEGIARLHLSRRRPTLVRSLTEHADRRAGGWVQFAVGPDPELQRRERLLNCCSFLYPAGPERVRRVAGAPGRLGLRLAGRPFPVDHMAVIDQVEQVPDPDSRVTLGPRRDRFGDPLLDLHWRIGADTTRTLRRVHELLAEHVATAGIGTLESALVHDSDAVPAYTDAAHPMGTTRMSEDPRHGVVDRDCRVHGVPNLYVAGSSVFPTAGNAPPTFTIVCLALRLADRLRRTLDP